LALARIADGVSNSLSFTYSTSTWLPFRSSALLLLQLGKRSFITTSSIHANSSDSTLAAPTSSAEVSKPFTIGISFKGEETLYLTNSAVASTKLADGIVCTITTTQQGEKSIGQLGCGPEKKAFTYS
jgi:hypothetical protein